MKKKRREARRGGYSIPLPERRLSKRKMGGRRAGEAPTVPHRDPTPIERETETVERGRRAGRSRWGCAFGVARWESAGVGGVRR